MDTFHNSYDSIEKLIFDLGIRIKAVDLVPQTHEMLISLTNNHRIKYSFSHLKGFEGVKPDAFMNHRLIADGTGIHWPELDEDLSLKGLLKEYLRQKIKEEQEIVIA
ncbi:Protein of unknown function [Cnuella takakiae]|uniref:DUF2442 domain-containing protein n=1 Tax=Cnuella takakiae TaxID=1302690 RepID=A0A1M5BUH5_9BACT|nr:DUF2442 domain-containing protein [Cnuella takakiae]OLY93522.1 hypothetical protein BUE76_17780 [Cnuella takakiae]SHF46224.1 Protein of unknown function [Cnuella takakiae]